jgi:hypothetical protein
LKAFPLRSGKRPGTPFLTLLFNRALEDLVKAIRQEEETTSMDIRKEEVKLSLFTDDRLLYTENSKKTSQKC